MSEKLQEFVRQTLDEMRKEWPPEERLKDLSADEIIKALPPEIREELARQLEANGSAPK